VGAVEHLDAERGANLGLEVVGSIGEVGGGVW
jgi:hypothetical protein